MKIFIAQYYRLRLKVFENRVLRRVFGPEGRGNKGMEKIT
jgi:hypothetical protein